MITYATKAIQRSIEYIKNHPQFLLVLLLLIAIPLLFLYTSQKFLDAGRYNQDRLQKDRVGLMHDVFVSLLVSTNFDAVIANREVARIASLNPDIQSFKISKKNGNELVSIADLDSDVVGTTEDIDELYQTASLRSDESIIFEFMTEEGRQWYTYRSIDVESGDQYFIFTLLSLKSVDDLFAATTRSAMYVLVFVYIFVAGLTYWHVRLTDYRYLYNKAQKANEMKDLFTNMIAHELRAPLTAIRGYASMVEEKTDGQEKEYSSRVRDSAERLLAIVNDLLDVARIQSGKLAVEKTEADVSVLIQNVLDELRVSGSEKNIELTSTGTDSAHMCLVDEKKLHQALTNLVSNAIKYTKEGSITVAVEEKRKTVEIRVKDTGMGISSDDQKKLFAPFFRVATNDVSKITGTGLGMWITKQLIEFMEGSITVESIKGVGTHVVVSLQKSQTK